MKTCTKCHETKPKTEFNKQKGGSDGMRSRCKPCVNAANAEYRAIPANRARIKASGAKYYIDNAAVILASQATYKAANSDKVKAYNATYYAENTDKCKVANDKWQADNPDKVKAYGVKWWAAHPEARRAKEHNRRARTRENGGKLSKGLAERLFKLQKGKCACCGKPLGKDFHLDHIIPIKLGGPNIDNNIQLLTAKCNNYKRAKHPVDFMRERGFLI